jgi:hypothetical protein
MISFRVNRTKHSDGQCSAHGFYWDQRVIGLLGDAVGDAENRNGGLDGLRPISPLERDSLEPTAGVRPDRSPASLRYGLPTRYPASSVREAFIVGQVF